MAAERSYDSLPNFTAADCLRLLGIGRNQYIDLMNQARSNKRTFRRGKPVREILPAKPVEIPIEPWWMVSVGCVLEDDVKVRLNARSTMFIRQEYDIILNGIDIPELHEKRERRNRYTLR